MSFNVEYPDGQLPLASPIVICVASNELPEIYADPPVKVSNKSMWYKRFLKHILLPLQNN